MRIIQSKSIADQVEEVLRGRIREGAYVPGSRIPSESELSDELGVSRATVRTVLAKLAVNGLILRKHGDGTYVNSRIRETGANFANLWDFATLIENNGYKPSIKPLSLVLRPPTEKEAPALAIEPGENVLAMARLFYADDQPVILANNVIPASYLSEPVDQIDGQLTIREILRRYCRQEIAFAITDIRSALAAKETISLMGEQSDRPILELQLAFYSKDNLPLALGINYFNDAILRLSLVQAWS
jgi:GntR family transcriptional regulator